jgi:hypothetical protein
MMVLVVLVFFITSCSSLLMPYSEDHLCRKGSEIGFCGSLSELYEDMEENPWKYRLEEER